MPAPRRPSPLGPGFPGNPARKKKYLLIWITICAAMPVASLLGWHSLAALSNGGGVGVGGRRASAEWRDSDALPGSRALKLKVVHSKPRYLGQQHASSSSSGSAASPPAAVAAAVLPGAGRHGFVEKSGPLDPQNWQRNFKSFRGRRAQAWLVERQQHLGAGELPPPLPLFGGCQVFVNHQYKVIYLRHAKSASSSLLCHFSGRCQWGDSSINATSDGAGSGSSAGSSSIDSSINSSLDSASSEQLAATNFELLRGMSPEKLERLWQEYFVVTFVRNPYQRAVSSYKMIMRQLTPGGAVHRKYRKAGGWDSFCRDPASFAAECSKDSRCAARGGSQFVYAHIMPQHQCLLNAEGGLAVDFIGRVENIDEDLNTVLLEIERRRPADAPSVKPLEGSLQNVNGRGCQESAADVRHPVAPEQYCDPAEYYSGKHAHCFSEVQHHYSDDVAGLQYGPAQLQHASAAAATDGSASSHGVH